MYESYRDFVTCIAFPFPSLFRFFSSLHFVSKHSFAFVYFYLYSFDCLFLFYLDRTYSSSEEEQSLDTQKREKFKFYLFILEPTTRRPERR